MWTRRPPYPRPPPCRGNTRGLDRRDPTRAHDAPRALKLGHRVALPARLVGPRSADRRRARRAHHRRRNRPPELIGLRRRAAERVLAWVGILAFVRLVQ